MRLQEIKFIIESVEIYALFLSSFRSLLAANGYYWVNPIKKPVSYGNIDEDELHHFDIETERWQSFEDNLLTGILLTLIKK